MAESVNLVEKWRKELDAVKDANMWDTEAELAWLAEEASKHKTILELGSFRGASTKIMALANPEARIVVIDAWHDEGTKEAFSELLKTELNEFRVYSIHATTDMGFSQIPDGFVPTFTFIDAGHLYEDVKNDIRNVLSLLEDKPVEEGDMFTIAGHDFRHGNLEDGVTKAATEAFSSLNFPADSIWYAKICREGAFPNLPKWNESEVDPKA